MKIDVLGPLEVGEGLALEPRARIALGVLVVRRNQVVAPEQLAEALWVGDPPSSWAKQVQICVSRLRKALDRDAIVTEPGGYRLVIDEGDVDAWQFEQLITRGHTLTADGEPDRAVVSYARALALWRGHPLEELDGWAGGQIEAARLQDLRRSAQEDWLDARLAAGDHRQVAIEAAVLVAEEPFRERRWRILALAQYRSGRQADALRSMAAARRTLREELGIDPGTDLVDLEAAILRQDAELNARAPSVSVSAACPYMGLAPYDVDDQAQFFGRDDEVALAIERLRASPLLMLVGPSGSGKSSLARAGLTPALIRLGRSVVTLVPGRDPDGALADALGASPASPVVVVDQFEEMFALGVSTPLVGGFCDRLARYAIDVAPVVLVVRSDHLGGIAVSPELSRLAEQGLHLVTPLAGAALRDAIEQPALQAGLRLEHGLVDLLERDTEGEPGALPLLSHALAETWRRRDGPVLTVEGYRASGGIRGAVANSADRLYDGLSSEQRSVLRSLLLRMVLPSLDGPPVRCRVSMRNVMGDPDRDRVMALLVRSRLVTAEEDSYEIAHEALARAWPRLQSWLEDDVDGQRIMRHLAARADEWDSLGRSASDLYRGSRLDVALEWRDETNPDLNPIEQDFLAASLALRRSEEQQQAASVRRQARQNRRLRILLVAVVLLLIAASTTAVVARNARSDARLEALVNQSLALRSADRAVAALLAVEAHRRQPGAQAWSALLGTFTSSPGFLGYRYVPDAQWLSGAVVPGTNDAVIALNGADLRIVDLDSGEVREPFVEAEPVAGGSRLAVSDDGRIVAQFADGATRSLCGIPESVEQADDGCAVLQVLEIGSGRLVMAPVAPPFGIGQVAVNSDGSLVAVTGGFAGDVAIYRTGDAELVALIDGLGRGSDEIVPWDVAGVDFGPDGLVYVGSMEGPVRVVDPAVGAVVDNWEAPRFSSNNHVVATRDGLVVGAGREGIVAFDAADGSLLWSVDLRDGRHPEPCPWFAVNAPRDVLYCGSFFGVIEVRSLRTGEPTGTVLDPQLGSVGATDVSLDGNELVAFGAGSPAITRWSLDGTGLASRLVAADHVAYDGYDTTGDSILVARRDPLVSNWDEFNDFATWDAADDTAISRVDRPFEGIGWAGPSTLVGYSVDENRIVYLDASSMEPVEALDVSPEAINLFISAGGAWQYVTYPDGEVWTVDPATRQRVEPTFRISGFPLIVSATRGGERVVITSIEDDDEAVTIVYDGRTGEQLNGRLVGPFSTSVSLDGTLVGTAGGEITEYDLETLEPLGTFAGARGEVNTLEFSHDGDALLAAANDQTVSVYDVATRRRIGDPIPAFSPFIGAGHLNPDGTQVAVNQRNGVAIWDIDPDHLAVAACKLAGRNLTETEWNTYLDDFGPYRATCPEYT